MGTVYDQELLKKIRQNAFAYLHGHEVGGTNPSLLEALAVTNLNLLLDVGFNREVGEDSAIYFSKSSGNLKDVIEKVDHLSNSAIEILGQKAKKNINERYTWELIIKKYEKLFIEGGKLR